MMEKQQVGDGIFLAGLMLTMPNPLRQHMPNVVYECTSRTIQGRFLMRPSSQLRRRMIGILCAAHELYPLVELHAFAVLSNHWECLASCECAEEFSLYIGYVNSNFARECGRAHGWSGPFWHRRVRIIPCLDATATVDRLRYCMAQGAKEGLVASPLDWPGATAVPALVGDMTLVGERVDRQALRRAREAAQRRGATVHTVREASYVCKTTLRLMPLPIFRHLDDATRRSRHEDLLADVVALAARERKGCPPLGLRRILRQDPHAAPDNFSPTPAPACHTSLPAMRRAFLRLRREFTAAYRTIADAIATLSSPRVQRRSAPRVSAASIASRPAAGVGSAAAPPAQVATWRDETKMLTVEWRLRELQTRVPPGMWLQPRFIRPAPPSLLADLAYVPLADR